MEYRDRVSGINIISKNREQLPYGNKDRGVFLPPEKGRRAIFVPSFGVMEKEEINDVVLAAQEKEDGRLKRREISPQKERLENITRGALEAKPGQRRKRIKEILKSEGDRWI